MPPKKKKQEGILEMVFTDGTKDIYWGTTEEE